MYICWRMVQDSLLSSLSFFTSFFNFYTCTCMCDVHVASVPKAMQLNPWRSRWPVHEFVVNRSYDHQALGIRYLHVSMTMDF